LATPASGVAEGAGAADGPVALGATDGSIAVGAATDGWSGAVPEGAGGGTGAGFGG
jgi:hypothetical protein